MAKFVDLEGLATFLTKMKEWTNSAINTAKSALQTNIDKKVNKTTTVNGHALTDDVTVTKSDVGLSAVTNDAQVKRSEMGTPSGVATLGTDGKVPTAQLPSYVDDVLDVYGGIKPASPVQNSTCTTDNAIVFYNTDTKTFVAQVASGSSRTYYAKWKGLTFFPDSTMYGTETATGVTPAAGKIYVYTGTNKTYRWSGSDLVEISASLALGTTSSTAFRGDYGNTAYQHAVKKGAAFDAGLYKITTNDQGHVTAATEVTKADITALGIPGEQGSYTLPQATYSVLGGVKLGSDTVQTVAAGTPSATSGRTYAVQKNSAGQTVVNVPWVNTTYGEVTTSKAGLMSASDKRLLQAHERDFGDLLTMGILAPDGDGFLQKIESVTPSATQITMQFIRQHISSVLDGSQPEEGFQTVTLPAATTSKAGLMSSADKAKLDGIATGATADSAVTTTEIEGLFS